MANMQGVTCIGCRRPTLERCTTEAGRREVAISKLCEPCFFECSRFDPDGWVAEEELQILVEGSCDGCPAYGMLSLTCDGYELCRKCYDEAAERNSQYGEA